MKWWKCDGYLQGRINGRQRLQHRIIMESYLGRALLPTEIIHHINRVRDDNRIENLQLTDRSTHTRHSNLTIHGRKQQQALSKFPGVVWNSKDRRWYARFKRMGRVVWLGTFRQELDAACVARAFLESEGKE